MVSKRPRSRLRPSGTCTAWQDGARGEGERLGLPGGIAWARKAFAWEPLTSPARG